ncbi:hypothetical protein SCHPADRAFT_897261 [Schizopora paradoxa]|uniref:Uncharacterized protein n=1 Tax=Schizopora paradoxa TaxID=27342 RepID=A0A0H2RGV0_9AGAM|nr:hypothetical protein SCHPADRAFT_897261 [Schizopora paradoxa]
MARTFSFLHNIADFNVPTRASFDRTAEEPLRQADVRRNFQHGVHAVLPSNVQFHLGLLDRHADGEYTYKDMFKHAVGFQINQMKARVRDLFNGSMYHGQQEDPTWFGSMRVEQMSALDLPLPPQTEIFWRNVGNGLWKKGSLEVVKEALDETQQGMLNAFAFLDTCVFQMQNLSDIPPGMFNIPPRLANDWKPYRPEGGIKELLALPLPTNTNNFVTSPFMQFSIEHAPPGALVVAAPAPQPAPTILPPTIAPIKHAPAFAPVEPAPVAANPLPLFLTTTFPTSPSPAVYEAPPVVYNLPELVRIEDNATPVPATEEERRALVRAGKRKAQDKDEQTYSPLQPNLELGGYVPYPSLASHSNVLQGGFLDANVAQSIARWREGPSKTSASAHPSDVAPKHADLWKPVGDEGTRAFGKAMPFRLSSVMAKEPVPALTAAVQSEAIASQAEVRTLGQDPLRSVKTGGAIARMVPGPLDTKLPPLASALKKANPPSKLNALAPAFVPKSQARASVSLPGIATLNIPLLAPTPRTVMAFAANAQQILLDSDSSHSSMPGLMSVSGSEDGLSGEESEELSAEDKRLMHERFHMANEGTRQELEGLAQMGTYEIIVPVPPYANELDSASNAFEYRYVPPNNSIASTVVSTEPCAYHQDSTGSTPCDRPFSDIEDVVPEPRPAQSCKGNVDFRAFPGHSGASPALPQSSPILPGPRGSSAHRQHQISAPGSLSGMCDDADVFP